MQSKHRVQHHRVGMVGQQAAAIAKIHGMTGNILYTFFGKQHADALNDLRHLTAVRAGVHAHRAAYAAGNTVGKFQSRQALLAGEIGHPCQRRTGAGPDVPFAGQFDAVHVTGVDDQAIHLTVRKQQIGTVAHNIGPCAALDGKVQQQHQLFAVPGKSHPPGRAANAEGGVLCQRLLRRHRQVGQVVPQLFVQKLIPKHEAPPKSFFK